MRKLTNKTRITLKEAKRFHGHLGPYLILGILAGEIAIKRLNCKKYFGISLKTRGVDKKPKSCFIDGLQLSTGATYGKGNIRKSKGSGIKVEFQNLLNNKKLNLKFKDSLVNILKETKTHGDSERLAKRLYHTDYSKLFKLTTNY